eukprot:TRINITY_DN5294_c0_g1_i5.p1 TRINITY_DN5294_c0_g1~~TRINITY_DN5294_c0_g1_i5.p1  ORF type:complete len:295 (+),score=64.13 TRINITY_DN5294_c0_g1_i5:202-1086(+)
MPAKDRTSDFLKATEVIRAACPPKSAKPMVSSHQKSSFGLQASQIRSHLNATTTKLTKLAQLAKSKTYAFGDPVREIDELSYVIKEDIKSLQMAVQAMQAQLAKQAGDTPQEQQHSTTVVSALKSNLADTATTFQEVLQTRAESMQAKQGRQNQFSSAGLRSRSNMMIPGLDMMGEGEDEEEDGDTVIDMSQMALISQTSENDYLESRAVAVENVQKTILELGGVFEQLALTVEQQRLQLQTIDNNVETAVVHIDDAQAVWQKYLADISSDRMLAAKVMGILITFALFFIVFLK